MIVGWSLAAVVAFIVKLPEAQRRAFVDAQLQLHLNPVLEDEIRRALPPESAAAFQQLLSKLRAWT